MQYGDYEGKAGWFDETSNTFFPEGSLQPGEYEGQTGLLDTSVNKFYPVEKSVLDAVHPPAPTIGQRLGSAYDWIKSKIAGGTPEPPTLESMPSHGVPSAPAVSPAASAPLREAAPPPEQLSPEALAPESQKAIDIIQRMKGTPVAPGMPTSAEEVAPQGLNERGQAILIKPLLKAPVETARTAALLSMPYQGEEGKQKVGEFIDKASETIKRLSPNADAGFVDRFVSGAVGLVPYLVTAGPGALALLSNSAAKGIDAIDQGIDPTTATELALKDLGVTAAMFKLPMGGKTFVGGMAKGAAVNTALDIASKGAEKGILAANEYPEEAKKVRVLNPESLGEAALMGAAFGAQQTAERMAASRSAQEPRPVVPMREEQPLPAPEAARGPEAPLKMPVEQPVEIPTPKPAAEVTGLSEPVAAGPSYAGPERRSDTALREQWGSMTPDEQFQHYQESHYDQRSGLMNMRGWDSTPRKNFVAYMDVDGLKDTNTIMGHAGGDELLRVFGSVLKDLGVDGTLKSGDEHLAQHDSYDILDSKLRDLQQRLANTDIKSFVPAGTDIEIKTAQGRSQKIHIPEDTIVTKKGVQFSYGIGPDEKTADRALYASKLERTASGLRGQPLSERFRSEPAPRIENPVSEHAPEQPQEVASPSTPAEPVTIEPRPKTAYERIQTMKGKEEEPPAPVEKPTIIEKIKSKYRSSGLASEHGGAGERPEASPFYSKLERYMQRVAGGNMTPERIRQLVKESGAKADDLTHSGIEDFLKENEGKKISKSDLLAYMQEKQAKIVPVEFANKIDKTLKPLNQKEIARYYHLDAGQAVGDLSAAEESELWELAKRRDTRLTATDSSKFGQWKIPGESIPGSYVEHFETVPGERDLQKEAIRREFQKFGLSADGDTSVNKIREAGGSEDLIDRWYKSFMQDKTVGEWRDGHAPYSEVKNPIVRWRGDGRTDADGKKVFFIHEIQAPNPENQAKMPKWAAKRWREIGIKSAIDYSVKNGYDRVALATGEQVAGLYDLSKQVTSVTWTPPVAYPEGSGILRAIKNGEAVMTEEIPQSKIADYVGKEIANRLIQSPLVTRHGTQMHELSGLDLKVGGEGIKKLYDRDLLGILNDLGKKWGTRVSDIKLIDDRARTTPTGNKLSALTETVKGIDIPPSMKSDVTYKGQELYSLGPVRKAYDFVLDNVIGKGIRAASEWSGRHTPPWVKDMIGKAVGLPNFTVEKNPLRRPIYDLNNDRVEERTENAFNIFNKDEKAGYAGAGSTLLTGKDKADFDAIAHLGDAKNPNYKPEQMTMDKNPTGKKVSQRAIDAYLTNREMLKREQDTIIRDTQEIALAPYEKAGFFDRLSRITNDLLDLRDKAKHEKYYAEMYREAEPDLQKALARANKYVDLIQQYEGQFEAHPWYMPRTRPEGEFLVRGYDTTQIVDGKPKQVWMGTAKTVAGAIKLKTSFEKNPREFLPVLSEYHRGKYRASWDRNRGLPEELYQGIGGRDAMESVIRRAVEKVGSREGLTPAETDALDEAIFETLAEEIATRGAGRHFIRRSEELIEGYETTDLARKMISQVNGMVGWLSKAKYAIRGLEAIKEIPTNKPSDLAWVHRYFQDSLRNAGTADRVFARAKGIAAVYYLGLDVSDAVMNSAQTFLTAVPEMSRYTKSNWRILTQAQKDVVTRHLTDFDRKVLDDASRKGIMQAKYVREITGRSESPVGQVFDKAVQGAMLPFQAVETYLNREPAFLSAMRLFTGAKDAKGHYYGVGKNDKPYSMSYDEAFKRASDFVNATHYNIGKENRPQWARGPVGGAAYAMQSFSHNYFHWIFSRATEGEFGVVARSMVVLLALGGIKALPGLADLNDFLEKYWGKAWNHRIKEAIRDKLKENVGSDADPITDVIMNGLPTLAGIDFSQKAAVGVPVLGGEDKTLTDRVFGIWSGLGKKAGQGIQALGYGDYERAAEKFAPQFIEHGVAAHRLATRGMTTMRGKPITDEKGKPVVYTPREAVEKGLGFVPERPSKLSEAASTEYNLKDYWNGKRDAALSRYRLAKTPKDLIEAKKIVEEFNREVARSDARLIVSPITQITLLNTKLPIPVGPGGQPNASEMIRRMKEGKFKEEMAR